MPGVAIRVQNRKLPGLSASAHSNLQWPVLVWENGICGPITSSDCFNLGLGGRGCPLGRLASRLAATRAGVRAACLPGVLGITAGNYGGNLGPFHLHLHKLLAAEG